MYLPVSRDDREEVLILEMLHAIGLDQSLTQRRLAKHMGVALGLANSYLKRCVRKGWVKIQAAPPNRYFYHLTRKGLREKGRLTAQYLSHSFEFYRQASNSCTSVLQMCSARGLRTIVLCGASELAEIATLRAEELGMSILGVFDPETDRRVFLRWPVWRHFGQVSDADVFLVTDLKAPEATHELLQDHLKSGCLVMMDMLDMPHMDILVDGTGNSLQ